ncbi:MAG: mannose-1-phosphate guanylyltransferase [Prolixibacteraceae bacterium]
MKQDTYLIVMAGGIGSRFWPMSTEEKPKQFLDMLGTGRTLFQQTIDRFQDICPTENILVVTSGKYLAIVKEQCPQLMDENILAEPCMRNTAPCIAYASYKIKKINTEATIIVTPADHLIADRSAFRDAILKGLDFVESTPAILTLGIQPRHPETGYGYIQMNDKNKEISSVSAFREKPDLATAISYLSENRFLWNSGIFLWSIDAIIRAFEKYSPELARVFEEGIPFYYTGREQDYINQIYPECENISIDYSILEKTDNLYVQRVNFDWSDLGTWSALWEKAGKGEFGNVSFSPNSSFYESSDNIVHVSPEKTVVIQGLTDYIVVEANNTLLICSKKEEQRIKIFLNDSIKKLT